MAEEEEEGRCCCVSGRPHPHISDGVRFAVCVGEGGSGRGGELYVCSNGHQLLLQVLPWGSPILPLLLLSDY